MKGDLVTNETGLPFMWLKPYGLDEAIAKNENNEEVRLKLPITFHPTFDPGNICTIENLNKV